jgi:hypothetical protein
VIKIINHISERANGKKLFRYKVFKMLLSRKKITEDLIDMMMGWRHSGFNVYCGPRIQPGEEEAMENLARYVVRVSFSQERMTYIPEESKVLYRSKDGKKENMFDALEWLAAICAHITCAGLLRRMHQDQAFPLKLLAKSFSGTQICRPLSFIWVKSATQRRLDRLRAFMPK